MYVCMYIRLFHVLSLSLSVSSLLMHPHPYVRVSCRNLIEVECMYAAYTENQLREIKQFRSDQLLPIPEDTNYYADVCMFAHIYHIYMYERMHVCMYVQELKFLSLAEREKLTARKPGTIADAARISGITPASLTSLALRLKVRSD